jgi:hypothetical protein
MFSIAKKSPVQVGEFLVGFCFLAMTCTSVSATEYRLFVNDAAACSSAGKTGSVCVVEVGATTFSSTTSATSTTITTTTTSEDTITDSVSVSAPAGGSVETGDLDFGSGGGNSGTRTYPITVTNDITAYPFTVKQGAYYGGVTIVPTSTPFPDDGTGVRLWWSKTAGGQPLGGASCSANLGKEGSRYWDQSKTKGYGCTIDNVTSNLYLNLQACDSAADDTTCGAADAKAGSAAPIYIQGKLGEVQ